MLSDSLFDVVAVGMSREVASYWHWSDGPDGHEAYTDEYYDVLFERLLPALDMQAILDLGGDDILFEREPIPPEVREHHEWRFTIMCLEAYWGE